MFCVLYEGKSNGSVAKSSSSLASPAQPGVSSSSTSSSALEPAALPVVSHHLCHIQLSFDPKLDNRGLFFFLQRSSRRAPPPRRHRQPRGRAIHHRARGRYGNLAGSTVRPGSPSRRRSLRIQSRASTASASGSSSATWS